MHLIKDKRYKRICKWIATVLVIVLLVNQSCFSVLAEEITEPEEVPVQAEIQEPEEVPVQAETQEPEEVPVQAETQEQQEVDVPEMTAQEPVETEPEIPVSQESGMGNENTEQSNDDPQTELDNTSYTDESETDLEPDTEMESGSETEESSEITMTEPEIVIADEMAVATEEELAVALLAGASKITLTADISLTTTMIVSAATDIVLDGQGFSLYRGADENGAFIGTMLYLSGTENAEEISGSLTLTNICVDGQNTGNRVGSSAIIDYGSLILDEGAVVKSNYNYGTYLSNESGEKEVVIPDYGGGIQVYGELTVTEDALVTGNFADEFGGGVYLAGGATLYLHADVIRENTVADGSGYGADLYAANGSTIYYNTAIDMTRAGFYICMDAILVGMGEPVAYAEAIGDNKAEVYINISETSGYTEAEIAELTRLLKKAGYTVLANRTNIDTTDLRDWYVYDHYDMNAWDELVKLGGKTWEEEYTENYKRHKYVYNESTAYIYMPSGIERVYTIKEWLENQNYYYVYDSYYEKSLFRLAQFKEHIYTRKDEKSGYPMMTFVGYGKPAYVDFLFYDPASDGEKVVNFEVDSSQVITHTLAGSGFLVNTGVEAGKLQGYLVYYVFGDSEITWQLDGAPTSSKATSLIIYKVDNIDVDALHGGSYDLKAESARTELFGEPIKRVSDFTWDNHMSIQIRVTPNTIEVKQQPTSKMTDIDTIPATLSCSIPESKYSGFGPLVVYTRDYNTHNCNRASSFTYSNLRMYFTNPPGDMLDALEKADFTQENPKKYFINLFGASDSKYNYTAGLGQYEDYLKIMQSEGVALITDRTTPFDEFLGDNLCEIEKNEDEILPVDSLVEKIREYINSKSTTNIQDKLQQEGSGEGLREVKPEHSVGNIWLKSVDSGKQIRTVNGDSIGGGGFTIQIMDDITCYYGNPTVTYSIIKPNGDIVTLTSNSFSVGMDSKEWPAGDYVVRQKIDNASVQGYSFFELKRTVAETGGNHSVTVDVKVDGESDNSGRTFALVAKNVEPITYISNLNQVPNGVYNLYETTGAADSSAYKDMDIAVTVSGADKTVTINYYTVTIYDESSVLGTPQIVRENEKASAPTVESKEGCTFDGWRTSLDGSEKFDFADPITKKTDVYASWLYTVVINANKDGNGWNDGGKTFALAVEDEETITFFDDFKVPKGVYKVYDTTGAADIEAYEDTRETVTVSGVGAAASVDYYTVTLYNDDAVWGTPQTVRKHATASRPAKDPGKDGHTFYRWLLDKNDNSTDFNFATPIEGTTVLYASWTKDPDIMFMITASAGVGGSVSPSGSVQVKSGDDQKFVITPSDGYEIDTVLVDDNTVVLENVNFVYRTLSGSVSTKLNAAEPEMIALQSDTAAINPLNDDNNNNVNAKQYTFYTVNENHTLSVTFKEIPKKKVTKKTPSSKSDDSPSTPISSPVVKTDTSVIPEPNIVTDVSEPASKDSEPKTGETSYVEIYATIGMIAGLSYLLLYFADGESGMTEEQKKEIVGALVKWARKGNRIRKYVALAIVFVILVYYHSIGKRTTVEWKELYEK